MKKIFALLLLAITLPAFAQVEFIKDDWDLALKKAKETNRPIFVDFYTDWCGWCKVMDNKTFADPGVAEYMNKNYISLKVDAEVGIGTRLSMKYRIWSFPTFAFFNSEGQLVTKLAGYRKVEPFMENLKEYKKMAEEGFYLQGVSTDLDLKYPEFYTKAFKDKNSKKKKEFPKDSVVFEYLKGADLMDEVTFSVVARFKGNTESNSNALSMKQELIQHYGKADVRTIMSRIAYYEYVEIEKEGDIEKFNNWLPRIGMLLEEDSENYSNSYHLRFLHKHEMWNEYAEKMDDMISKKKADNSFINSRSWNIYEKIEDKKLNKKALEWMEKVIEAEPNYMYLDTYAALLYKNGKYNKALQYAEKAIKAGKDSGEDVKETEELIKKIKKEQS